MFFLSTFKKLSQKQTPLLHRVGVLEEGKRTRNELGVPQGGVFLVRYADDFVMGFEHESDARGMMAALKQRLSKFGLALHEDKTRLLMFGRFAAERRAERKLGRPETFDFLGFTHYCDKTRNGRFIVRRKTQRKRMIRKLKDLRREAWRRMHIPVKDQWRWLSAVLRGHYAYYGLTGNYRAMKRFLQEVEALWQRVLARRSQKARMFGPRFFKLLRRFPLPGPTIINPQRATPVT